VLWVGIKLLRNRGPAEVVSLALMLRLNIGCPLKPVKLQTDGNGEEFRVVPLAIEPPST